MTTLPQTSPVRQQRQLPGNQLAMPGQSGLAQTQAPVSNAMTAADVWRVIRSNIWLILVVLLLSTALGYGLNTWLSMRHSRYTSTGYIEVKVKEELFNFDPAHSVRTNPAELDVEKGTHVKLLLHERLISTMLENSDAVRDTEFFKTYVSYRNGQKVTDMEAAKADLLDHLDVKSVPDSKLIAVSFSGPIPKECKTIVEELVYQHIQDQQNKSDTNDVDVAHRLEQLKLNYETQIRETLARMAQLTTELGTLGSGPGYGLSSKDIELQQLTSERTKADDVYGAALAKLDTFNKQLATNSAPELEEALQKDQLYIEYHRMVDDLEGVLGNIEVQQGSKNPRTEAARHRLDQMQKKLVDRENEIKARTAVIIQTNLQNDAVAAESARTRVTDRINQVRSECSVIDQKRSDFQQLQNELVNLRAQLDEVKKKQDMFASVTTTGKWAPVAWATLPDLPDHPTFPKWYFVIPLTVMVGLGLSLGIAFLRELTDTTVRTPRDIARVGQLTLLGMIPHESDDPEAATARLPLAIFEAPQSIIAEQFRHVRTRLQHSASLDTTRSILVTGCSPEDGKTTVAVNLAAGLALNGRRILLVDANFRRPALHDVFNCANDIGFGDVLNDPDMFQDVVSDTEVPNLALITSGTRPSNPTELLESQLLIDFIERALEEYDHVIFDSGPLLMVSDSIALAPRVDGVVTVVRATGNSRGMLGRMRDELRRLKAEHLGVVLNAVRVHGGGYYGPMIKKYYAYQNG